MFVHGCMAVFVRRMCVCVCVLRPFIVQLCTAHRPQIGGEEKNTTT